MAGFQTQISTELAHAVAGDFASHGIRADVLAGPGALVAAPEGVTIAHFAWLDYSRVDGDNAPAIVRSTGDGLPAGFIHREQQGLILSPMAASGMQILGGYPVVVHNQGAFFVKNDGTTYAAPGMKAYARLSDGAVQFAATGTTIATAADGAGAVTALTFSTTGSISGNVLTVTAVGSGTVVPGATISGSNVASGTKIVSQLPVISGETLGGVGRYAVSIAEQDAASTTISGTYGLLTITTAPTTGTIGVGGILSGTSVTSGARITALGTGAGGLGTYIVDPTMASGAQTDLRVTLAIETKWFATSGGAAGELVKMSSFALG